MIPFLPLILPFATSILGWLAQRKLISEAFLGSYYQWVDSLGVRQKIPAELRQRVLDQRARLDAKEVVQAEPKNSETKEK